MALFGSKQEGTGAKKVAIATSQYKPPGSLLRHNTLVPSFNYLSPSFS